MGHTKLGWRIQITFLDMVHRPHIKKKYCVCENLGQWQVAPNGSAKSGHAVTWGIEHLIILMKFSMSTVNIFTEGRVSQIYF